MNRPGWSPALGAAPLVLGGCASFNRTKPAPLQSQPITVRITHDDLSGWTDLPTGTYRVPDSQVIISGHQKGGAAGILFGVIGAAVQSDVNSSGGKTAVKSAEDVLHITLTPQAQDIASKWVSSGAFANKFTVADNPASPTLSVTTALVITFVSATDARPYVVLKASLTDPKQTKPAWTTRYIASAGQPLPLTGEHSWTADNGAALNAAVTADLEHALKFMLTDVATPFARDETHMVIVEGSFPYIKQHVQTLGYTLSEDPQSVAFIPKIGDVMVFSGVNLMDKSVTTVNATTDNKPVFKLLN